MYDETKQLPSSFKGSGTLLVRLYKDNASILGHLPQSAQLTNFGRLQNMTNLGLSPSFSLPGLYAYPIGTLLWKVSQILTASTHGI